MASTMKRTKTSSHHKASEVSSELLRRFELDEDKENFKQAYKSAHWVLEVLADVINERLDRNVRDEESEENFTLPAFSEYVAKNIGERKAMRSLLKLLPSK